MSSVFVARRARDHIVLVEVPLVGILLATVPYLVFLSLNALSVLVSDESRVQQVPNLILNTLHSIPHSHKALGGSGHAAPDV